MRAWWIVGLVATAAADPKPAKVDVKPMREALVILADSDGAIYAVRPAVPSTDTAPSIDGRVFFGNTKQLSEQIVTGGGSDGADWNLSTWAPRSSSGYGSLQYKDGSYYAWCGSKSKPLTQLTGTKAAAILDRAAFQGELNMRRPYLLARDDLGTYYYVDHLGRAYGGKDFRVFVGKKGKLVAQPVGDAAVDSAGDIFTTKAGILQHVFTPSDDALVETVTWIHDKDRTPLVKLDVDANAQLVWTDLGIYKTLGTMCD